MKCHLLLGLIVTVVVCACSSVDCPVQNTVRTKYVLKKLDATADTLNDTLSITSHRANGTDTLLLNKVVAQTSFTLPIGYSNPEDTLFFNIRGKTSATMDTVWIKKENIPHFESVDCSATFFHTLTAVRSTHHGIDSIGINNPSVTYDPDVENFYIYFKSRR